jgi:sugar fermentation stimulation protein A
VAPGVVALPPLIEATFLRRYKRFLVDVQFDDGAQITVHCPNTGSMRGLDRPGCRCRVSTADNPKRKYAHTLEQLFVDGVWVMTHTGRPNRVVQAAIEAGRIPELCGFEDLVAERPFPGGHGRVDLVGIEESGRKTWIEVKNVTLVEEGIARFPDAVSTRASRHLEALRFAVEIGDRAVLLLHVGRADGDVVRPADAIDPHWGASLRRVVGEGVEVMAWRCQVDVDRLQLIEPVVVDLSVPGR